MRAARSISACARSSADAESAPSAAPDAPAASASARAAFAARNRSSTGASSFATSGASIRPAAPHSSRAPRSAARSRASTTSAVVGSGSPLQPRLQLPASASTTRKGTADERARGSELMGDLGVRAYSTGRPVAFHARAAGALAIGAHAPKNAAAMEHTAYAPAAPAADAPPAGRALVVGASSGMGAALVRELVARGWRVAALARRGAELERLAAEAPGRVVARAHDVHDVDAVPALFEELVRTLGGLDLVVYAAGVMPKVAPAEFDVAKDREILAVNVLGAIAWLNPAAEYFQAQRAGTIVGIGSIAGDRGRRGNPVYGASKAALAHYLEALRNRLSDHGVRVCTIKPGFVATPMTADLGNLPGIVSAESAARTIAGYARRGSGRRFVPLKWLAVSLVIRNIPSRIFRTLQI